MPRAAASAVPLPIASTWVVAERGDESHSYRQAGGAGQHSGSRLAECAAQGELGGGPPLQCPGDAAIDVVDDEDRQYYVCHPRRPPGAQPRGQAAGRQAQDPERHGDAAEVQHDAGHREVNEPAHSPWSPWPVCGHRVAHPPIIGCSREGSLQVRLTYSASASRGGKTRNALAARPEHPFGPRQQPSQTGAVERRHRDAAVPARHRIALAVPQAVDLVEDEQRRTSMPMSCSTRRTASMRRSQSGAAASTTWRKRRDRQPAEPPDTSLAPRDPSVCPFGLAASRRDCSPRRQCEDGRSACRYALDDAD